MLTYANAPAGQVNDPGNRYDTTETIKQIDDHDAVYEKLCPSSQ